MWRPPLNFITIHYGWILFMGALSLLVIAPARNMPVVDAYFFGASASTESGLNTIDVKLLMTYQQLYIYFIPMLTNIGFINIFPVAVRLWWFEKRLRTTGRPAVSTSATREEQDLENEHVTSRDWEAQGTEQNGEIQDAGRDTEPKDDNQPDENGDSVARAETNDSELSRASERGTPISQRPRRISFAKTRERTRRDSETLYIPPPQAQDKGEKIREVERIISNDGEDKEHIGESSSRCVGSSRDVHMRRHPTAHSIEQVASSMFVLGSSQQPSSPRRAAAPAWAKLPFLSKFATVGRNSQFNNLTAADRERLGGVEYRALKLLLKIIVGYFFGLHLFGAICLVIWIHNAPPQYADYLAECGQDKTWWAFYSAQTMVDNLGFTLTPDSMIRFRDAAWPMLLMSFLAFAGNTLYPVVLRLVIWVLGKVAPRDSSTEETLHFLLEHPRRCYTLLFPSRPTWILFGIIFALNLIDVIFIITLDLHNQEVASLPIGPRILAAIFQAASARHTGTASFNLANVSPAVQFSLVVMMYVAILPIAISIRASNTYEEKSMGLYSQEQNLDETRGTSYVMTHVRNQLSFDLWYIFLGTFLICIAEATRIMDNNDPAVNVFSIFFEVVSGYGNVGLSLGYPTVSTSLVGVLTTFSKVVICAMMIRGRHRGLPYGIDRAIMLPSEHTDVEQTSPRT